MCLPSLAPLIARLRAEDGQDLAEYGLLLLLIAVVVIAAVTLVGTQISTLFQSIANSWPGS